MRDESAFPTRSKNLGLLSACQSQIFYLLHLLDDYTYLALCQDFSHPQ